MVTGIKDNLGGWILMLKAISQLRQLLKFCCMEAINECVLFGVLVFGFYFGFPCAYFNTVNPIMSLCYFWKRN